MFFCDWRIFLTLAVVFFTAACQLGCYVTTVAQPSYLLSS